MFIFQFLRKTMKKHRHSKMLKLLNYGKGQNDYFLVSYPKSGNTWVRFLIANILKEEGEEITLKNIGDFVPDIYVPSQRENIINKSSRFNSFAFKFVKSHDPYFKFYKDKKVIYLVRDGRDTLNSYFYYLKSRKEKELSIRQLILGEKGTEYGIWSDHIVSWYNASCQKKLFLRYEDILKDAFTEISKMLSYIGWDVPEDRIKKAIEDSYFDNLRKKEEKYGGINEINPEKGDKTSFFRKGQKGDWKNLFTIEDEEMFWSMHGDAMELFKYER